MDASADTCGGLCSGTAGAAGTSLAEEPPVASASTAMGMASGLTLSLSPWGVAFLLSLSSCSTSLLLLSLMSAALTRALIFSLVVSVNTFSNLFLHSAVCGLCWVLLSAAIHPGQFGVLPCSVISRLKILKSRVSFDSPSAGTRGASSLLGMGTSCCSTRSSWNCSPLRS